MSNEQDNSIYVVDAFVGEGLAGNPAAVCPRGDWLADDVMQEIAREMALSETAFYAPKGDGSYLLRWFTPATEVELCGHATLASAHILWQTGKVPREEGWPMASWVSRNMRSRR